MYYMLKTSSPIHSQFSSPALKLKESISFQRVVLSIVLTPVANFLSPAAECWWCCDEVQKNTFWHSCMKFKMNF